MDIGSSTDRETKIIRYTMVYKRLQLIKGNIGKQKLLPNKKSLVTPKKKVSKKRKADPPIPPYEPGS